MTTSIGIIVVTHGDAGASMVRAAERVAGHIPSLRTVAVTPDEARPLVEQRIEEAVEELRVDEVLFLVDLSGSTPSNLCCRSCQGRSAVVSGLNLPMLFKLATADRSGGALHLADELARTGQKSISVRGYGGEPTGGGTRMSIAESTLEIVNELGMHARAATKFVQTAKRFKSEITVEKDGQVVNGKSIMGVLMLVASKGTFIKVRATGEDANEALELLGALVRDKFGEE